MNRVTLKARSHPLSRKETETGELDIESGAPPSRWSLLDLLYSLLSPQPFYLVTERT